MNMQQLQKLGVADGCDGVELMNWYCIKMRNILTLAKLVVDLYNKMH